MLGRFPRRVSLMLAAVMALLGAGVAPPVGASNAHILVEQSQCQFVLGFAELREVVGIDQVGDCIEDQHFAPNGDAQQQTTGGLLAWIKAENRTIFTDGFRTWTARPDGLQVSLNPTEAASANRPPPPPAPAPPAPVPTSSAWTSASATLEGISGLDPSPEYPADNRIFRVNSQLIEVSTTQGRTWEQVGTRSSCPRPTPNAYLFVSLLLSPTLQTDNTILAFGSGRSAPLAISSNSGQSWTCLPQRFVQAYQNATALFSPTFARDHRLWVRGTVNGNSSIESSGDTGQTWNPVGLPMNLARVTAFAVTGSATGRTTLLIAHNDSTRSPSARYFRSIDLDRTWQEITESFRDLLTLQVPSLTFQAGVDADRVYATTASQPSAQTQLGTWFSADAGATWQLISPRHAEGATPDGCGVLTDATSMELSCNAVPAAVAPLPPDSSPHVLSVANFADHGTVLVGTSHGLWTYQFRP